MVRKSAVDLYIGCDCTVREVYCKSIIDPTSDVQRVSLHGTSDIDYAQPNVYLCWHCSSPFDTPPVPLPIRYDPLQRVFSVEGNMCSLACAKTYLNTRDSCDTSHRLLLLKQIAMCHYNQQLTAIVPAPPHTALITFGGNMTIEEFRGSETRVEVLTPPFVPQRCIVKEQHRSSDVVGWSVYGMRRMPPSAPTVVMGGERGLYFDFLRQAGQREAETTQSLHPPVAVPSQSAGALEQFLK
jgi:hypothetical protein